jgi:hypothetical protein
MKATRGKNSTHLVGENTVLAPSFKQLSPFLIETNNEKKKRKGDK